jgi:phosphatidylinositol-3,4,5-trisphosphate 3-phosphatase/dual-specificity protein phosphatase PTEN
LDDFTELTYKRLLLEKRILAQKKSTKSACIRSLVSENRVRYKDEDFNLDLAYITPRLIAMGFPSSGLRKIYRNSIG